MANENNDLNVRQYQLEFKEMLQTVFQKEAYFGDMFAGGLEALDGVQENENAFYVKTSDIPVVMGEYDTDPDTAFGDGTGSSSRFGKRTEVIYTNTPVPYTWGWVYHEGIDRHTVNNDLEAAVADRTLLQAQAKTAEFNRHHAEFISGAAGKAIYGGITAENLTSVFNELDEHFVNVGAVGTRVAKVTATVRNLIIDSKEATTSKNSSANIDDNSVLKYKDFVIQVLPESAFKAGDIVYAYVTGVAKAFTGINTARTIESEDFDGVAFQGAGKAGEYIPEANKKAVAKVTKNLQGDENEGA